MQRNLLQERGSAHSPPVPPHASFAEVRKVSLNKRERDEIKARVSWWINDMCFKAPEQLTEGYYEHMANDVADLAEELANTEQE